MREARSLDMAAKACEREPPRAWKPRIPASETRKAIKAYSIAMAPDSSERNERNSLLACRKYLRTD